MSKSSSRRYRYGPRRAAACVTATGARPPVLPTSPGSLSPSYRCLTHHIVVQFRSITHYKNVLRQAVELMNHDDLTGLPNRRHLKSRFWVLRRHAVPMALLYFDLNGFKAVNDTHGHEMGDRVLSVIGQRLQQNIRPGEMVARLAGDEFAVLLAGTDLNSSDRVAERLLQALEEPIHLDHVTISLTASVGAALHPCTPSRSRRCSLTPTRACTSRSTARTETVTRAARGCATRPAAWSPLSAAPWTSRPAG